MNTQKETHKKKCIVKQETGRCIVCEKESNLYAEAIIAYVQGKISREELNIIRDNFEIYDQNT